MDDKIGNTPIYIHDCLCKQVPKHPILSHVTFYCTFDILFFLLIEIFNIFQPHPTLPNQTYPSVYPFYFIGNIEIFRLKICDSTFTRLFCSTHNFHFTLTLLFPNIEFTFLCVWFSFDFVFTFKYLKWKCNNHIKVKVFLHAIPQPYILLWLTGYSVIYLYLLGSICNIQQVHLLFPIYMFIFHIDSYLIKIHIYRLKGIIYNISGLLSTPFNGQGVINLFGMFIW